MDDGTRHWFDKLEGKIDKFGLMVTEEITALKTLIGVYLPKQDNQEERINRLEDDVAELKAEGKNRSRNHNVWLGIGTIASAIIAVIIGILIDRFFFK